MEFKNILRLLGVGILAMTIGVGLGYRYAPDKIKIQEKIVEKEVVKKEEYSKKTKKYDKDGKVVEESEEKGTKQTDVNTKKTDKTTEKQKTQKNYAIKAGIAKSLTNSDNPTYRVGAEVRLPVFNSWLGGEIDTDDVKAGVYLRMEF